MKAGQTKKKGNGNGKGRDSRKQLVVVDIDALADEMLPGGRISSGDVTIQLIVRANVSLNKRVVANILALTVPWVLLVMKHVGIGP